MELIGKENLYWTDHVRRKMMQYRLSESRVKRVLRHPARREVGVAEDTIAGMQPAGSSKNPYEIWVMWTTKGKGKNEKIKNTPHPSSFLGEEKRREKIKFNFGKKITIISAWRYPGVSPIGEPPPIPDEVWAILKKTKH